MEGIGYQRSELVSHRAQIVKTSADGLPGARNWVREGERKEGSSGQNFLPSCLAPTGFQLSNPESPPRPSSLAAPVPCLGHSGATECRAKKEVAPESDPGLPRSGESASQPLPSAHRARAGHSAQRPLSSEQ